MDTWASRVAELKSRAWSITQIGRAIGLSPQAVTDIEKGRSKAPTGMAAVKLHRIHEAGQTPEEWAASQAADGDEARAA